MKSILTFLLIILMDIQFNYACPCSPTNTLIEMNESFASQFQTATIIPMFLWQPSWSYPIEGLAIGLLISLIVYYRMVYSTKLFPHEKLRLILNITHKTQTPLTLIHHLLEEIISDSLSESTSQKVKRILRYTSHIMSCYQNIAVFDDKENELHPGSSPIEFELYTFITSIVNQCRAYADTRQIKLNINKDFSYISCRVDEITMTAALQCLLNKMIEATPCKGCINMDVSHSIKHWNLQTGMQTKSQKDAFVHLYIYVNTLLRKSSNYKKDNPLTWWKVDWQLSRTVNNSPGYCTYQRIL